MQQVHESQQAQEMSVAWDPVGDAWLAALQDDGHTCGPLCEQELGIAQVHWTELPLAAPLGEA
ncbi:hypothetical protein [Streptacidiphilus fuscans]|uniref:hypothetical protein n=1 Tax=Streptacidiphilus fuscans TaxID=2789292 RepID=UPI001F389299|nr:hypothetical protein [Streptacidiphilus fuscans]